MTEPRRHIAFCPHCGNRSPQRVALRHSYRDSWYSEDGTETPHDEAPDSEAIVCICETCSAVLLYDGIAYDESGSWPELMYPRDTGLHKSVPEIIRATYHEATLVKRNSPNAFAMLIRKGLEAICDDRGASSGTLAVRLKLLSEKGDIPPVLADVTTSCALSAIQPHMERFRQLHSQWPGRLMIFFESLSSMYMLPQAN